jgi:WhiB family transcriptional regulator, redox-sensing transcriptional regulator
MSTNEEHLGNWAHLASCRALDPELFFPATANDEDAAKAVCAGCPVRQPCLDHALAASEPYGIWGGLTLRERRLLRRARSGEHRLRLATTTAG